MPAPRLGAVTDIGVRGLRHADGGDLWVLGLHPRTQVAERRRRVGGRRQRPSVAWPW